MKSRRVKLIVSTPCRITLFDQKPKLVETKEYKKATNLTRMQYNNLSKTPSINSFTINREIQKDNNTNKQKAINTLIRLHLQRLRIKSKSTRETEITIERFPEYSYDSYSLNQITKESRQLINSFKDHSPKRKLLNSIARNLFVEPIRGSIQEISKKEIERVSTSLDIRKEETMPGWFNEIIRDLNAKEKIMKQAIRSISMNHSIDFSFIIDCKPKVIKIKKDFIKSR